MKGLAIFLAASLAAGIALGSAAASDYSRTFAEASRAYDEGRLDDAVAGWSALLDAGQELPEVLYNLGNAHFRLGHLGAAIRAYRHAQTLAPRDPDVRANLLFAAQTAGTVLPARPPVADLLLEASQDEWRTIASLSFWLLCAAAAVSLLWPRARFAARPPAILATALLALAFAGLWTYRDLRRAPECVLVASGHKVRSGPLERATPLLSLPEGSIVRRLDQRDAWVEIRHGDVRGWLPAAAVQPVWPADR